MRESTELCSTVQFNGLITDTLTLGFFKYTTEKIKQKTELKIK